MYPDKPRKCLAGYCSYEPEYIIDIILSSFLKEGDHKVVEDLSYIILHIFLFKSLCPTDFSLYKGSKIWAIFLDVVMIITVPR